MIEQKIIGDFIGVTIENDVTWDHLDLAITKIEHTVCLCSLGHIVKIKLNKCKIVEDDSYQDMITQHSAKTRKEAVKLCVLDFIKWAKDFNEPPVRPKY